MKMTEKSLLALTAADVMSRDVMTIPHHLSLRAAAHRLAQSHVSGAPVTDEKGRCIGVLSAHDLMTWVDQGAKGGTESADVCSDWQLMELDQVPEDEVSRYMTTDVVATRPEAGIGEIARWMVDAHIHRVIILDSAQRPVGVVSSTDILAAVATYADE
jgi:CBS-domain-containing membrane protein